MTAEMEITNAIIDSNADAFLSPCCGASIVSEACQDCFMSPQRIANRLFLEVSYHYGCELEHWYDDALTFMETRIDPKEARSRLEAIAARDKETLRGCGCNAMPEMSRDVRTEFRASLEAQIHQHDPRTTSGSPALL